MDETLTTCGGQNGQVLTACHTRKQGTASLGVPWLALPAEIAAELAQTRTEGQRNGGKKWDELESPSSQANGEDRLRLVGHDAGTRDTPTAAYRLQGNTTQVSKTLAHSN